MLNNTNETLGEHSSSARDDVPVFLCILTKHVRQRFCYLRRTLFSGLRIRIRRRQNAGQMSADGMESKQYASEQEKRAAREINALCSYYKIDRFRHNTNISNGCVLPSITRAVRLAVTRARVSADNPLRVLHGFDGSKTVVFEMVAVHLEIEGRIGHFCSVGMNQHSVAL